MKNHCTFEWQFLRGEIVEVRRGFVLYRHGLVDDVMPDASGLWLASDGIESREFIHKASGFTIWTTQLSTRTAVGDVQPQPTLQAK
jgi:hypothetical protein